MSRIASDKYREQIGFVLIVLAALALAAATFAFYVERNLFNPARFADHAQSSLQSPAVRQVAADTITNEVIEEIDPDLVAIRPLVSTTTAALIDTAYFKRLFRGAVLQAHRSIVSNDVDSAVVVLANIGVLVDQSLRRIAPEVAGQIPDGFDAKLVSVAEGSWESDIAGVARRADKLAWILPLAAFLLYAVALAVVVRRRRALWRSAVSVAIVGVILTIAYAFANSAVLLQFTEGIERDAAGDVWSEFMNGYLFLVVGLATAGSALAAAASGTLQPTDVDARARELFALATRPPQRLVSRVAWSLALVAVGVWAMIDPLALARTLGFLAGFALVFRGSNELITLGMPDGARQPADGSAAARSGSSGGRGLFRRAAIFAAAMLVLFIASVALATAILGEEGLQRLGVIPDTRSCNGSERLCVKRFDEVTYAATHNSMSDKTYPGGWLFPEQDGPVSQQLAAGVRGLMLDVYFGFPGARVYTDGDLSSPSVRNSLYEEFGREFVAAADRIRRTLSEPDEDAKRLMYLCHGFCELGATPIDETFGQIRDFLEANPREVLVIVFQDYVPTSDLAGEINRSGLEKYVYKGLLGPPWPKLSEMIDSNQRVVLMNENRTSPAVPWIHQAYEVMQETPFGFKNFKQLESHTSCNENRGDADSSIFLVNHWIDTAPAARPSNARRANSRDVLLPRVERCQKIRERRANLIAVDFYGQGDLMAVTDELNGVE